MIKLHTPISTAKAKEIATATLQSAGLTREDLELKLGWATKNGVYLKKWAPKDRNGISLGKVFNVYAAPHDLTNEDEEKEIYSYLDTVKRIAELKNWNGYDGTSYATDKEIYAALKDGSYNGGWIIPTSDVLSGYEIHEGQDMDSKKRIENNLYNHKNTRELAGTFTEGTAVHPYWSSTEADGDPSLAFSVRFSDGAEVFYHKEDRRHFCRPVRLVEMKP